MRSLSKGGTLFIASFEGYRPKAYNDGADPPNATIGYGHLLHPGAVSAADEKLYWSRDYALAVLAHDAAAAASTVNKMVTRRLAISPRKAQARFDMLVSFCFNVGASNFKCSSLLREVNREGAPRDWRTVAPYWLEWVWAGHVRLPGLERRRAAEVANFLRGRILTW